MLQTRHIQEMNSSLFAHEKWQNVFAAATIGVLSFSGLIAYILVIIVIVRNPQTFAKNSYYTFQTSLAVSDSTILSLYLLYAVPCILQQEYILGETVDIVVGVIFNVAYFSCLTCIAAIGINRYWGVCRFYTYDERFSERNTKYFVCFVWALGLFLGGFQAFPCCHLRFYFNAYSFIYDMNCWGNRYFQWVDRFSTLASLSIILTCYYRILRRKPHFRASIVSHNVAGSGLNTVRLNKRKNVERNLAMQFGVIILVLIVAGLSFTIVPELTTNWWFMLMDSALYIINNGCNPYIYLVFNSAIRAHFCGTYCGRNPMKPKVPDVQIQAIVFPPVNIGNNRNGSGPKGFTTKEIIHASTDEGNSSRCAY